MRVVGQTETSIYYLWSWTCLPYVCKNQDQWSNSNKVTCAMGDLATCMLVPVCDYQKDYINATKVEQCKSNAPQNQPIDFSKTKSIDCKTNNPNDYNLIHF